MERSPESSAILQYTLASLVSPTALPIQDLEPVVPRKKGSWQADTFPETLKKRTSYATPKCDRLVSQQESAGAARNGKKKKTSLDGAEGG